MQITVRVLSRFSRVRLFVSLWTAACQALLSMGFSRQEHWSRLPLPSPEIDMYTLLYLKRVTNKDVLYSTGTLLSIISQSRWEGSLRDNGYRYMYV